MLNNIHTDHFFYAQHVHTIVYNGKLLDFFRQVRARPTTVLWRVRGTAKFCGVSMLIINTEKFNYLAHRHQFAVKMRSSVYLYISSRSLPGFYILSCCILKSKEKHFIIFPCVLQSQLLFYRCLVFIEYKDRCFEVFNNVVRNESIRSNLSSFHNNYLTQYLLNRNISVTIIPRLQANQYTIVQVYSMLTEIISLKC